MKPARSILCAVMAVTMSGLPFTLQAAGPATTLPAAVAPVAQPADARLASLIQAIRQAQDPSAAIQAYHDASNFAPSDVAVEQAYVMRMVDFGLPEMADVQAQDLIRRNPQDGLAWAVAAYMSAKREQNDLAIKDIAMAVRLEPGNPFVLRTAGQVAAWYDNKADKSQVPEDARTSLALIKTQLAANPAYAEAYRNAGDAYRQLAATPATQPTEEKPWVSTYPYTYPQSAVTPQNETTQPPADIGNDENAYTTSPPASYTTYNTNYYTYPNPYVSYSDYAYWWPGPYWGVGLGWGWGWGWGGSWWWPTCSSVVIVNNGFHSHGHGGFNCNDPAFFHHNGQNFHSNQNFAFNHHDGNHFTNNGRNNAFVSGNRTGTVNARFNNGTLASANNGRAFVPNSRGATVNRGTMSAPIRQTPAFNGGRQFGTAPTRVAPSANFGRVDSGDRKSVV